MEAPAKITIRQAVMEDAPVLAELMTELIGKEVTEADMLNRLEFVRSSPFDSFYVAEDCGGIDSSGGVCGALGFRIRENLESATRYGEVSVIVVSRTAKRRGIGRQLMDYAEELSRENGCKGTWLVTGFKREAEAHRFYKELGYTETGYRFVKDA